MNEAVAEEYKAIRVKHPWLRASQAILWARANLRPLNLEWDTFAGNHFAVGSGERDGFDIKVFVDYDTYGFGSHPTPTDENTGILNPNFRWNGSEWDSKGTPRFLALESGYTLPQLAEDYRKRGWAKNPAWEYARESLRDEAADYLGDDYVELDYTAKAYVEGVELGEATLGSDMTIDYMRLERDLDDTVSETDIIERAIEEAREALPAIVAKMRVRAEAVAAKAATVEAHLTT